MNTRRSCTGRFIHFAVLGAMALSAWGGRSGAAGEIPGGGRLVNLSARCTVTPGSALIAGFVISGSSPKQVLIRAAGPTLALPPFNLANTVARPSIQLFRGDAVVTQNDNWEIPAANAAAVAAAAGQAGAFPFRPGSGDAALLSTLPPGAYTAVLGGGAGEILAEVYEAREPDEIPGARRLVNLSARGPVGPAMPLIAGFVISGPAPHRVLIRGVGPALAAQPFNLPGALANPQLSLFRGNAAIKHNDDWFQEPDASALGAAAAAVGAFPLGAQSLDAAMLADLEPGSYTVHVAGSANAGAGASGVALVEVYEVAPGTGFNGAQTATIRLAPQTDRGPVNRLILGHNLLGYVSPDNPAADTRKTGAGVWDPVGRRPVPGVVELARAAGMTVARFPGGCGAHLYDWKQAVGPLEARPDVQFGIPEFLRTCVEMGATPIWTLAEYVGTPADAADLVEYLNAPVGANPNGGKDWAAVRAADGRTEPWNVLLFEFGNESYHGNHRGRKFTPEEYARQYLATRTAMRAVDARVQLGLVAQNSAVTTVETMPLWTRTSLEICGRDVDFVITHPYLPSYQIETDPVSLAPALLTAGLAASSQWDAHFSALRETIRRATGRGDVPLALTEYNGLFVQQKPLPYRHTLGNALINAELVRVAMQPEHRVWMANQWQFANSYFGMVEGSAAPYRKRPNYFVYEFYARHFGEVIIPAEVECGTYDTVGGWGVQPFQGGPTSFRLFDANLLPAQLWRISTTPNVRQHEEEGMLVADIETAADFNYYHASKRMPAEPGTHYRMTGEIRVEGLESANGALLEVGDARGWTATHSVASSDEVHSGEWTRVTVDYATLGDAREISILARRLSGLGYGAGRGRLQFRNVEVRKFIPQSPGAVPYLGVNASRSRDGGRVFLMIANKHLTRPIDTRIEGIQAVAASAWSLVGPEVQSTNEQDPDTVGVVTLGARVEGGAVLLSLPKHSLTAVEIETKP